MNLPLVRPANSKSLQRKILDTERFEKVRKTYDVLSNNVRVRGDILLQQIKRHNDSSLALRNKMILARKRRAQLGINRSSRQQSQQTPLPNLILAQNQDSSPKKYVSQTIQPPQNRSITIEQPKGPLVIQDRKRKVHLIIQNLYKKDIELLDRRAAYMFQRRRIQSLKVQNHIRKRMSSYQIY